MGAASRRDPTKVRVGNLAETSVCPLARHVRQRLRRRGVDPAAVYAVWSVESPMQPLPPDENEPRSERGRVRNRLPSLITVPGVFGYALAAVALDLLLVPRAASPAAGTASDR
jgi:tRNA A37 threonylcarbamoyladenosine dehydratase